MTIDGGPHRVAEVAEQMPSVGGLARRRRTLTGAVGIKTAPVTDNDLDAGVLAQPGRETRGAALGQEVDNTAQFKVAQDGPVGLSFAPRPFIDPEHARRRRLLEFDGADHAQQPSAANRHGEVVRQAPPRRTTSGKSETLLRVKRAAGAASFGEGDR